MTARVILITEQFIAIAIANVKPPLKSGNCIVLFIVLEQLRQDQFNGFS